MNIKKILVVIFLISLPIVIIDLFEHSLIIGIMGRILIAPLFISGIALFFIFSNKSIQNDDHVSLTGSRYISAQTKREVWIRDGGRCVQCGKQERLEFDHIIPFSKGGSNTARNIQLLCEKCNKYKSNNI